MTTKQVEKSRKDAKQKKNLSDLSNMARKIAEYNLDAVGYYFCVIDGVKTEIIK